MDNSTNNVYKFSKEVLKTGLEQAQKAGVDVKKVIQLSLAKNLKEDNVEKLDALTDEMQKDANQLLGEIDDIIDGVFEKFKKDPIKFKILLDTLRKERLQADLESAKITLDKTLLDTIAIEPIDFNKLKVTPPDGLESKIADDTPEQIRNFKDHTLIEGEITKLTPKLSEKEEDFTGFKKILQKNIDKEIDLGKLGYKADDIIRMNAQEYNKNIEQKFFYYIKESRHNELKCLSYNKDRGWSEIKSGNVRVDISCEELRNDRILGLEDIIDPIFPQLFLQTLEEIVAKIEKIGKSRQNEEGSAHKIGKLYKLLKEEKDSNIKTMLMEKLNVGIDLLNRYSDRFWYYKDSKETMDHGYASSTESKLEDIKNSEYFSDSTLIFFEKQYMQEILQENNEITKNILTLESHINKEQTNHRNSDEIKSISNKIIWNIKKVDHLLEDGRSSENVEGIIYKEAGQLRISFLEQLQRIMEVWNRVENSYFHYLIEENNSIQFKEQYADRDPSNQFEGKGMQKNNENTLVYYEKLYFQKAVGFIKDINEEIEKIKQKKSENPENLFPTIARKIGDCLYDLAKIRKDSPLKGMANTLIEILNKKMQTMADILSQDENVKYIYTYENGSKGLKKGSYLSQLKDKIEGSDSESQLRQHFLQQYSIEIAKEYIDFQNVLANANEGDDTLEKVDRLLKIKKEDWKKINNRIAELNGKSKSLNIEETLTLLNGQKKQTLDTIINILRDMNKTLELYAKNDIQEIPESAETTKKTIKEYKEKAEKEYPEETKGLNSLAEVWNKIDNQKMQLNTLQNHNKYKNEIDSKYSKILEELSIIPEDAQDSRYIQKNSTLKEYLDDSERKQKELNNFMGKNNITNTKVQDGMKALQSLRAEYVKTFTEKIQTINNILNKRYTNISRKEAPFSISETVHLNEILKEFEDKKGSIKDRLEGKEKEELDQEQKNSETITKARIEFESLCKLTGTDIDKITANQNIDAFDDVIHNFVKQASNMPVLKGTTEFNLNEQINPFVNRQKKLIALKIKFSQQTEVIQEMVVDEFFRENNNLYGLKKDSVSKWLKQRLEDINIENNKLNTYPEFIKTFVLKAVNGDVDSDIKQKMKEQRREDIKISKKQLEKKRNSFIDTLNTKSLRDYTNFKFTDQRDDKLESQTIKEDESIHDSDKEDIQEMIREFDKEYIKLMERDEEPSSLSLSTALTPHQSEKFDELCTIYRHDVPVDKSEDFKDILKMIGRRNMSQFNGNFFKELIIHENAHTALIDLIPFKQLVEKVDLTNQLEVKRWKEAVVTKITSKIENKEQRKNIEKYIEEYIDIILTLPSKILEGGYINMRYLENYKESMSNYTNVILPVKKFEEAVAKKPEEVLQKKVDELMEDSKLKNIIKLHSTNEEIENILKENEIKFWKELDLDTQDGIKNAMIILKETFYDNELIKRNYDEFISFGKTTIISLRKNKIIKTLNPKRLFDDALEETKIKLSNNKQEESELLKTAIRNITNDMKTIKNMMTNITHVFNENINISDAEKLTNEVINTYVSLVLDSKTRDDFKNNFSVFIKEYQAFVLKINENYVKPMVKEKSDTTYKDVKDLEEKIEKLKTGTLDYFKNLEEKK